MTALPVAIFCRVIDNVGDAGVCWRLARQLATEHRREVWLYVDRLEVMQPLWSREGPAAPIAGPASDAGADGAPVWIVEGVRVCHWPSDAYRFARDMLVLCTFACDLPAGLRVQMAGQTSREPRWINVEHLSAEPWVESAHRRVSIKPADGAREYYFFPGFTPATGGLLREADLAGRQARLGDPADREAFLRELGVPAPAAGGRPVTISLFCYPVDVVGKLLARLARHPTPVRLLVPEGVAAEPLARFFGRPLRRDDGPLQAGALQAVALPWLDQRAYDALLRACDLNFVRGEDSWIRAHWAGRPFVWQPYPQPAEPRREKLEAWLDRLVGGWPAHAAEATRLMHRAWIDEADFDDSWAPFQDWALSAQGARAWQRFADQLAQQRDLASQLIEFTQSPATG